MKLTRSVHIFPHKTPSSHHQQVEERKVSKKVEETQRMDRYFKLRQMFCDYLETKGGESTKTPPTPIYYPMISTMTEEDKKRLTCKKITEEEAESFDLPADHPRPLICHDPPFELRWYNKPDALGGRFQTNSEAEAASKMAQRLLTFFLKTEMLESVSFKYDDIRAIRVFFMDDREMANDRLLAILDNIFAVSMNKLGQFSDKISVAVDYELRAFMMDQKKAKRLVLEAMLKYPEFVPDSWGGEAAILKWKEMKEADVRRREADAKDMVENEKKEREEKTKNEEEKVKKEKERQEKEERIKKEVEEAERKKKEEKEQRRREVKKEREQTRKDAKAGDEKTAFEKGFKELLGGGKKNKNKDEKAKKKKKDNTKKTVETTKTKDLSHEEPPPAYPTHSPQAPHGSGKPPPPTTPATLQTHPHPHHMPHQTPPRKTFSVAGVGQFLSGRKRREHASAEKLGGGPPVKHSHPKKEGKEKHKKTTSGGR